MDTYQSLKVYMASSHREHRQDKTVLSCRIGVRGVKWIGDKTRLSVTENFETVLSCPDPVSNSHAMWLPIVTSFGNWVKTSSQMRSHRRQDKTVLSPIYWTVCDCHELSSHREHRQDKTVWTSHKCHWAAEMLPYPFTCELVQSSFNHINQTKCTGD